MSDQMQKEPHTGERERDSASRVETLISALNENVTLIAHRMRLETDAVIVNQCNENARSQYFYGPCLIRCIHVHERGVGRSRNRALDEARAEIVLFSDEDIVYDEGYAERVSGAFDTYTDADLILFNVRQSTGRHTYHIEKAGRVNGFNYGRYPTYAIAARLASIRRAGIRFSHDFGGGATYMNGEDSLFLHDCLKASLRIYKVPAMLGRESEGESTWFEGYTDTFFFDRGVLYHYLYGKAAVPCAIRFLLKNKREMCREKSFRECLQKMKEGIAHGAVSSGHGSDDSAIDTHQG